MVNGLPDDLVGLYLVAEMHEFLVSQGNVRPRTKASISKNDDENGRSLRESSDPSL
jgi:hypothetical protein